MNTTEILLIRHGETDWNAERRLQGHIDIPLNAQGLRQAQALGMALRLEPLDAIISSDLQRAQQTASAVLRCQPDAQHLALRIDAQLRERCFGGFEGLSYTELAQRYPEEFAAYRARLPDARLPDGERRGEEFAVFFQRVTQAMHNWGRRFIGKKIALVAHGGVLECAYRAALDMPLASPRDFEIFNASINRFQWQNGKLILQSWGDVAHLKEQALDEIDEQAAA